MSVGSWSPETPKSDAAENKVLPDEGLLRLFIGLSEKENLESMKEQLPQSIIETHQGLMRLQIHVWKPLIEQFQDEELYHLIRFFTRAEMLLPGWDAGADSPVVCLAKFLRQRKVPLNKQQLLWIKTHSTNKFIPNGALL